MSRSHDGTPMADQPMPDWGAAEAVPDGLTPADVQAVDAEVADALEDAPVPLTPRERAAQELLAAVHLQTLVGETVTAKRTAAAAVFVKVAQREPASLGGVHLGVVQLNNGASTWKVTDGGAFLVWCREHRPEEVEEFTNPEELQAIVERVAAALAAADWDAVPAAKLMAALQPAPGSWGTRVRPSFTSAVLAAGKKGNPIESLTSGELWQVGAIPGVLLSTAAPSLHVETDKTPATRAAVVAALGGAAAVLGIEA